MTEASVSTVSVLLAIRPPGVIVRQDLRDRGVVVRVFKILGPMLDVQTIAAGRAIRELRRLRRVYGKGRWRKRKGIARIEFSDGSIHTAEVHWYEAHGIGRKEAKIKRLIS